MGAVFAYANPPIHGDKKVRIDKIDGLVKDQEMNWMSGSDTSAACVPARTAA